MAVETYDADPKKKIITMLKKKKNHHLPSEGEAAPSEDEQKGGGSGGGRGRGGRLCPTSEARHLLLSLSIADYEVQKERLLRLILKHNAEDRQCTHPDLVREDGEVAEEEEEQWQPTLEPPDGSDELTPSTSAAATNDAQRQNHNNQPERPEQAEPPNNLPTNHHHPHSASAIINEEAAELLKKAFVTSLTPSQLQLVLAAMRDDIRLPFTIGLTPERFPELVENNPIAATEILLLFIKTSNLFTTTNSSSSSSSSSAGTAEGDSSPTAAATTTTSPTKAKAAEGVKDTKDASGSSLPEVSNAIVLDYFAVLLNMEVSVHSLEVVNRLTTTVELPSEFLHNYVSNCIQTCFNYKEKYMQNRLVRLVCVFLSSIIRRKIIDLKDIFLELESFCVDFSRIREAAALFRLMKQISSGGEADGAFATSTTTTSNNNNSIPTGQCDQLEKPPPPSSTSNTSSSSAPSTSSPSSTSPSLFGGGGE